MKLNGLRNGGSPWLVRLAAPNARDVVLHLGTEVEVCGFATEVAALEFAGLHGVLAPRLLAADLIGAVRPGVLAVLSTRLTGTSWVTAEPSAVRVA